MGHSDPLVLGFYKKNIKPQADVALLGFTNNSVFKGDLYDLSLGNWEINSQWTLPKKYKTIISTRCPYFAKDPEDFVRRVYDHLEDGGTAYLDWGLGDHWRFKDYKIGWVKNSNQEFAYADDNHLWSILWDDDYAQLPEAKNFIRNCEKFGYNDLNEAIAEEVPKVLKTKDISYWGDISVRLLSWWSDLPQLYVLFKLKK